MNTNMNIKSKTSFNPNYAVHPGEILSDILESKGISQIELCKRMGRPEKTISEIISGKSAITAETALQLEQALGIPAEFWNRLESTYQEINTKLKNKEKLKDEVKCLRNYPYKELINRGWINKRDSDVDQAEELLRYFGVTSLQNLQSVMPVAFRVTKAKTVQAENIAAWLRKGELDAENIQTSDFNDTKLKDGLVQIKSFSKLPPKDFYPLLVKLLNECGIVLVITQYMNNTQICGASRWITPKKALIQLSLKGKYADSMWFTLFHEIAHLLFHSKKEYYIDLDPKEILNPSEIEKEANNWASEQIIAPKYMNLFQSFGNLNRDSILRYADLMNIHPGILVGRLQNMQILSYSEFTELKEQYDYRDFNLNINVASSED